MKTPRRRLMKPSHASVAASRPGLLAPPPIATEARKNTTPSSRLVRGPTKVIHACAPGELLSLLKRDTPPNSQSVIPSTRTPRRTATIE